MKERDRQLNTSLVNAGFLDRSIESLRYCPALGAPVISNGSSSTQQTYSVTRGGPTSPISDVLEEHFLLLQNHLYETFLVSLDLLCLSA
ncbi:MAG TPA: hypothetical protein VLA84_03690, partial [Microcoleus sp.]|nr:hypothetical protein [Microcoleus sp.]